LGAEALTTVTASVRSVNGWVIETRSPSRCRLA